MIRQGIAILCLALLAGCSSNGTDTSRADVNRTYNSNKATAAEPTAPELAAYAGHATYPASQTPSDHLRAAAIVSSDRTAIKIYNFTHEPIRDCDVWVNGSFVQHISGVAAESSVVIRMNQLYNGLGKSFSSQGEPVSHVQIASHGELYNLQGPASD